MQDLDSNTIELRSRYPPSDMGASSTRKVNRALWAIACFNPDPSTQKWLYGY